MYLILSPLITEACFFGGGGGGVAGAHTACTGAHSLPNMEVIVQRDYAQFTLVQHS